MDRKLKKLQRGPASLRPVSSHSYILPNYTTKPKPGNGHWHNVYYMVRCHFITGVDSTNHHNQDKKLSHHHKDLTHVLLWNHHQPHLLPTPLQTPGNYQSLLSLCNAVISRWLHGWNQTYLTFETGFFHLACGRWGPSRQLHAPIVCYYYC